MTWAEERRRLGAREGNDWQVTAQQVDMSRAARPVRLLAFNALPQSVMIDAAKSALIIIDMQNDFCAADGWLAHIGVDITPARTPIEPLARLLPELRRHGVAVIWLNWGNRSDRANLPPALLHVYNPDGRSVGLGDRLPGRADGARVLEKGSPSAAIVDGLVAADTDLHVDKYRMSGFWDAELDSILRNRGITMVLFAGVNADQCVLATLIDANCLGYDTLMLEDCSATTSPAFCWDATVYNVRQCFGFTAQSGDLIAALRALESQ